LGGAAWYGATQTETGRLQVGKIRALAAAFQGPETKTETVLINPQSGKSELKAGEEGAEQPASPQPAASPAPVETPPPAAPKGNPAPAPQIDAEPQGKPPAAQEEQLAAITPPQAPPAETAKAEPAKWVSAFDGGPCFLAIGQGRADGPVSIEGFGDRVEPFEELNRRFKGAYGIEPEIGLRTVTKQQCPVVEFARRTAGSDPRMAFGLKSDVLKRGQKLDANISGAGGDNIGIFVVTPDGLMVNVSAMAERSGGETVIQIPYEAFASKAGDAYLLLAVSSDIPLPPFERGKAKETAAFFDALRPGQENGSVSAAVKFVRKR
jgi:hypothetical protein